MTSLEDVTVVTLICMNYIRPRKCTDEKFLRYTNPVKALTALIFLVLSASIAAAQTTDKRVAEIDALLTETNASVAASEKEGEYSPIYTIELAVNKVGVQYPAVGTYSHIAKFYYTFGDREKDPYPNRLLKINVVTRRSAMVTNAEFLYDTKGSLIFGLVRTEGVEQRKTRLYFAAGVLIKMIDDGKEVNVRQRSVLDTATTLKNESTRLVTMFRSTLKEGL